MHLPEIMALVLMLVAFALSLYFLVLPKRRRLLAADKRKE
jgi:hypothetical protein